MTKQEKYQIIDAILLDVPTSTFVDTFVNDINQKINLNITSKNYEIQQILQKLFEKLDLRHKLSGIIKIFVRYGDAYVLQDIVENIGVEKLDVLYPHFIDDIMIGENMNKKFSFRNPFSKNSGYLFEPSYMLHFSHESIFKPLLEANSIDKKLSGYYENNSLLKIYELLIIEKITHQLIKLCFTHLIVLGYKGEDLSNFDMTIKVDNLKTDEDVVFEILEKLENIENLIKGLSTISGEKVGKMINNIQNRL